MAQTPDPEARVHAHDGARPVHLRSAVAGATCACGAPASHANETDHRGSGPPCGEWDGRHVGRRSLWRGAPSTDPFATHEPGGRSCRAVRYGTCTHRGDDETCVRGHRNRQRAPDDRERRAEREVALCAGGGARSQLARSQPSTPAGGRGRRGLRAQRHPGRRRPGRRRPGRCWGHGTLVGDARATNGRGQAGRRGGTPHSLERKARGLAPVARRRGRLRPPPLVADARPDRCALWTLVGRLHGRMWWTYYISLLGYIAGSAERAACIRRDATDNDYGTGRSDDLLRIGRPEAEPRSFAPSVPIAQLPR